MTTRCKSDLSAIYRLEFYKKKDSWKLYQDANKKETNDKETEKTNSREPCSNRQLNQTYNVVDGLEVELEPEPALNEAFLDTEQVVSQPEQEYDVWSAQYTPQHREPQPAWGDLDCGDGCGGEEAFYRAQPEGSDVYYSLEGAQYLPGTHWREGDGADAGSAWCIDYAPSYCIDEAGRISPADSVTAFAIGAAAVPHSSEVDLLALDNGPPAKWQPCWPPAGGYGIRDLRPQTSFSLDHADILTASFDCPTRDTGPVPHAFHSETFHVGRPTRYRDADPFGMESLREMMRNDSFVAGSFRNVPEGRGRGRLRERVIGIGMGRPYRL